MAMVTNTTETLVSHSLAYTALTPGTHCHCNAHPGPIPTCTWPHTGAFNLIPPEESGPMCSTQVPSPKVIQTTDTDIATQIHTGTTNTQTPLTHTHIQIHTICTQGLLSVHTHPDSHTHRPSLHTQPHKLPCHLAPCALLADTHQRPPPTSV